MNEREIFIGALQKEAPGERRTYLDEACGDDAALRECVESLLRVFGQVGGFLESPPPGLNTAAAPADTMDEAIRERPGTVIGPYKLLQQIGEGGMGTVFMAEQTHPVQRKVAIKVIKAGMDSRQVIARFEAERQALAMMDHVNIARVLDAGSTESGRPYFVMELVHGVPITKYCDDNRLTPRERLELFVPVCQAIQHAHQKGIIHRDIKPSNVMITLYDGKPVPKVIDFGVAKATEQRLTERTMFTQYGTMVGTPQYMSPEQAEMSALGVDTRSDIFSLGVLLYELLTGSTPLSHKRLKEAAYGEVLRMIKEEEPPKPSTRLSDSGEALASISAQRQMEPAKLTKLVRGELDWIVMKSLEKDRNRRYETANGLAADVLRYLNDEAVLACPPSKWYRFRKSARRNKGAVLAASIVVLALVGGIVGTTWGMVRAKDAQNDAVNETKQKERALEDKGAALQTAEVNLREAERQEGLAKENEKTAKAQELLAGRRFYAAQMNLALQAWEAGQPARALSLLESQRPRVDEEDLRSFEWYYLWRLCQGGYRLRLPMVNYDNASVLAISPDGKTLASGFKNTVKLWDTFTGQEIGTLTGHRGLVGWLAFTPDGKRVISAGDVTIRVWDLATAKELRALTPGPGSSNARFSLAGDGNTVALAGATVTLWDLTTGRQVSVVTSGGKHFYDAPAIAANGQAVAACRRDDVVKVWARDGDSWREQPDIHGHGSAAALAFSPDGKVLAVAGQTLKCYDPATGRARLTLLGHSGGVLSVLSVNFSADGKVLASGGHDQTARLWDAITGRVLTCLAHPLPVHGVVLSADGKVVATAVGGIRVWDAAPPEAAIVLADKAAVLAVALSPDGKTLASAGLAGTKLWDLPERRIITTLPAPPIPPPWKVGLAFSPDRKTLATGRHRTGTIAMWSVSGEGRGMLEGHAGAIRCLAFSRDGKSLASASADGKALLWDLGARKPRAIINLCGIMSVVAFSPDGKSLAAGSQFGVVKLFDAATGRETATLRRFEFAADLTLALAFSADSTLLAASDRQGLVQIWESRTSRLHAALKGHVGAVWSMSFAPDGRTVATAGADHTVRLWDVATGQERCRLTGHRGPVFAVEFAPDGNTLITGSADGTVRLWAAGVDARARAAKEELDPEVPGTPAAHNELGDRLWQYGQTVDAEREYGAALIRLEKLAAKFPDSPGLRQEMIRSLLSRSLLMERTGRTGGATPLRKLARNMYHSLSPNDQQALVFGYSERGRKLWSMSNHRQAERTCTQVLELDPTHVSALYWRGKSYECFSEWDKAAADYAQLLQLQPTFGGSLYNHLAQSMATSEDPKFRDPVRAVQLARQAVQLSPKEGNYWNTLGVAHYRGGNWKAAVTALHKSTELRNGGDSFDWFLLAMAHRQIGNNEEAYKWYDQALQWMDENMPQNEQLHRFRVEAEESWQGQAEAFFTQAIEQNPADPRRWWHRGRCLAERNLWGRAREDFHQAVDLRPDDLKQLRQVARFCLSHGRPKEALAAYQRAIQRSPENTKLKFRREQFAANVVAAWNFDAGPDAWAAARDCTLSTSDGTLRIESTGPDPQIVVNVRALPAWKELRLRIKSTRKCKAQLFWNTERNPAFAEDRSVHFDVEGSTEFTEVKVRFNPSSPLVELRLDADNTSGIQWEIDTITLAKVDAPSSRTAPL